MKMRINWDGLGIATSLACAIHCAVLPLLLTSLPLFGMNILHNATFEWIMIAIAIAVGIYSLVHGYIRHHRSYLPLLIFAAGTCMLVTKQFMPHHESKFLFSAVALIIIAHYSNYKLCSKNKCHSSHHSH
jgi:hypothetical protein